MMDYNNRVTEKSILDATKWFENLKNNSQRQFKIAE